MSHIHTQPGQHDHTVSAFVLRTDLDEPKLVLHLHKLLHRYMQFGGHIELDETPWQAITHELLEESGYNLNQLQLLQPKHRINTLTGSKLHPIPVAHHTHHFDGEHFHTDISYVFSTNSAPRHKVAASESQDMLLLSRQEIVNLRDDQIFPQVRQIALHIFDTCLKEWEPADQENFA